MRRVAAILIGLVAGTGAATAQTHGWDCSAFDTLPQQGINSCLADEYHKADADLNAAYQAALAHSTDAMGALLRDAQRAWIPFRDAACQAEAEFMRGGSGEAMLWFGCLARMTEARTEELRIFGELR